MSASAVIPTQLVTALPDNSTHAGPSRYVSSGWACRGAQLARRQAVQGLFCAVLSGTAVLGAAGVELAVGAGAVKVTFCAPL